MRYVLLLAFVLGLAAPAAHADRFAPITDPVVKKECGACHMAYQPIFLRKSSWSRIMSNLENHFGEDASLDPKVRKRIRHYMVKHARDRGDKVLRITELRWWKRKHSREVSKKQWDRAGSAANCQACHKAAERGYYGG
ncbi:MAG: cytochrome C [Alphaproteobacteria bacterium]